MKICAINGSPRKKWNTARILRNVLDGALEIEPSMAWEMVDLYDLDYKGCVSCFECKRLGGPSYGKCAVKDGISPLLVSALHADILVFGSPIYFGDVTGMIRCFWERLFFPVFVYDANYSSLAPRKLFSAFIYTMNVDEKVMAEWHYPERLKTMENFAAGAFGHQPRVQYVCDTYQFGDYSKYKMEIFSEAEKARRRETQFPTDCRKAREMGHALARDALEQGRAGA